MIIALVVNPEEMVLAWDGVAKSNFFEVRDKKVFLLSGSSRDLHHKPFE